MAALEELLYEYTLIGRAKLGLFVRLEGTGSFVLKDVINSLNGFNENALTEDADLSYKIYSMGYRLRPPLSDVLVSSRLPLYHLSLCFTSHENLGTTSFITATSSTYSTL